MHNACLAERARLKRKHGPQRERERERNKPSPRSWCALIAVTQVQLPLTPLLRTMPTALLRRTL